MLQPISQHDEEHREAEAEVDEPHVIEEVRHERQHRRRQQTGPRADRVRQSRIASGSSSRYAVMRIFSAISGGTIRTHRERQPAQRVGHRARVGRVIFAEHLAIRAIKSRNRTALYKWLGPSCEGKYLKARSGVICRIRSAVKIALRQSDNQLRNPSSMMRNRDAIESVAQRRRMSSITNRLIAALQTRARGVRLPNVGTREKRCIGRLRDCRSNFLAERNHFQHRLRRTVCPRDRANRRCALWPALWCRSSARRR